MLDNDNDNDNDKKNGKGRKAKTITYRLRFIDSCRFMQDSLSNLVDNLSGINNKECKNKFTDSLRSMTESLSQSIDKVSKIDKKISQNKFIDNMRLMAFSLTQSINKILEIDRKISQINKKEADNTFIDNMRSMTSSLFHSFDRVSEIDRKISHAALIENFYNTYQLSNKDLNKFALLLRKSVYPYEYMDSWNKFNEPVPLVEEHYYSELNKQDITKEDLKHVKKLCDTFKIKNLGDYHDLYVQSDTALLANVFENLRDKCIDKYELDPARFLSAPGLAWKACLEKD